MRLILHRRLADRLRAYADEAANLGARSAHGILRAYADLLDRDPDAVRRVARELRETVTRYGEGAAEYPIARVWAAAAADASSPMRLRRPPSSPVGLAAVEPERRRRIQAIGQSARRALPKERQLEIGRKAAETRARLGTGRGGSPRKLSDEQVVEVRRLRAEGLAQQEIAERFGVSRALVSQIVRGKARVKTRGGHELPRLAEG